VVDLERRKTLSPAGNSSPMFQSAIRILGFIETELYVLLNKITRKLATSKKLSLGVLEGESATV
jgi:hypothetical protein